ncbi:carbon catabolite repressor protein 4 homolog 6 [Rutidosis leptorrhynchoides]|uniref:carbon catabolite repressor protein 4 homolog 6 n=1 Tax=Rutidosis leptorrhynchoides TaxID=125765 RepID=UPI003A9A3689
MFNNRSSPSPQFLATIAAMSFRSSPSYRGGRNQWRSRGYSSRPYAPVTDNVVNDNHDVNREFRPDNNPPPPRSYFRPNFNPQNNQNQLYHPRGQSPQPYSNPYQQFAPPPLYNQNQQFRQQGPQPPQLNPNQQFRPPSFYNQGQQPPNFDQNHQFRPQQRFRSQQQFRQRQAKPVSDYRNWEHSKPGPSPNCERFTILSYNILADYLAINHRSKLYFHIPRHILDWEFRKKNIMFELGLWSADILCFQEVDRFQDLEEELKNRGYNGIWKMRTGDPVDGCAIFWRSSRFKLLHEEAIEFSKFGLRDNVAQICVLESINKVSSESPPPACSEDRNKVVVCNIHVLYNPKRGEIKLGQVRRLLDRAYDTSKLWDNAPVVLCGDFNSTPKSPLYNFISEQKLNVSGLARDKISGQYSAENRPRRPFTSTFRPQPTDNMTPSVNTQSKSSSDTPDLTDLQLEAKKEIGENDTTSASPDELLESIDDVSVGEDSTSFLSELHGPDGVDLVNGNGTTEAEDLDCSFSTNGESFVERPVYDPSGWTPMEIEAATGSSECTTMEHKLILRSAYTEVEDYSGTRDSNGEPQVTSYHRGFQGTVDYIWRSKGLQTARVLAPIPKQAMQWTPGFPTKKWGSDHIALVAELAFSKDVNEENSEVK